MTLFSLELKSLQYPLSSKLNGTHSRSRRFAEHRSLLNLPTSVRCPGHCTAYTVCKGVSEIDVPYEFLEDLRTRKLGKKTPLHGIRISENVVIDVMKYRFSFTVTNPFSFGFKHN